MAGIVKGLFQGRSAADPVWMTPDELTRGLRSDMPPTVVDVRTPEEFSGPLGHIEGARMIPLDRFETAMPALLAEQRPVVLVCHTDRRSSAAARMLQQAGGTNVAILRGGMVAWRNHGL